MTSTVFNLADFDSRQVERRLNVPPTSDIEIKSMRMVFNFMAAELPENFGGRPSVRNRAIADMVMEEVAPRYRLCKQGIVDFFPPGYDLDYNAVMLCVIGADYIETLHTSNAGDPVFGDDLIERAGIIWDEAKDILRCDVPDDISEIVSLKGFFIGHINAIESLHETEMSFDDSASEDKFRALLDETLPRMRDICHRGKIIGDVLWEYLNHVEAAIQYHLAPSEQPLFLTSATKTGSVLHLVPMPT